MTPDQVSAVTAFGPYKTFSNGDLETYKGVFNGREENFQFFFDEQKKLRRIGIYLYEGQDLQAGAKKWVELYTTISKMFGAIETPDNAAPVDDKANADFSTKAIQVVESTGKTQMAPINQPDDVFVFSSLMRSNVEGKNIYDVVLYFDRRQ